jgi:HEAT repeat protein
VFWNDFEMKFMRCPLPAMLTVALAVPATAADGIDSPMYRDPELALPKVVRTFPAGLADRWLAVLDRPEADLQAQAAAAIALAHERGMSGLAAAVGPLTRLLDSPSPAVRTAAARALVALDARDAAAALLKLTTTDPEVRDRIEPVLARWDYRPARIVWLERLNDPPPFRRAHVLAMQGLAAVKEQKAADSLQAITLSDRYAGPHRIEAARALGVIRTAGSESEAEKLMSDSSPHGIPTRLAAAWILRHHSGDAAVKLLQSLARDPEPAVAAVALSRLVEIDAKLVVPLLPTVFASLGADVRALGVEALNKVPSAENARLLGARLHDLHRDVRERARHGLRSFANQPALRDVVIGEAMRSLSANDWRGQEPAAILVGQLGHRPAAPRLVELLRSDRPEPAIASAWALRVLAVPDTLPGVLDHVRLRHGQLKANSPSAGLRGFTPEQLDAQLTQLVQFLGAAKHKPADTELRSLFPRFLQSGKPPVFNPVGPETRAAALWALGRLHAGNPAAELVGPIEERLTGDPGMGRDDERVRRMAAIALARMKAKDSLAALRTEAGERPTLDPVALACRWAVAELTAEPMPPPGVYEQLQRDWFLVPAGGK